MINYKKYFLRQLSIKESQFKQSEVDRNAFPGIDPEELEVGKEEEEEEHGFPPKQAQKIAIDHLKEPDQHHYYKGVEKAKGMGMLKDINVMGMSPTAIPTPIIGFTVRGSSTGGLPSGLDQRRSNITPTNLGGYEKIPIETLNSKLVDKTPTNSQINSSAPISTVKSDTNDVEQHPHQIQNASGEPPQAVTGADIDHDDRLNATSEPTKVVDIDVSEEEKTVNETFARHKRFLKTKLIEKTRSSK